MKELTKEGTGKAKHLAPYCQDAALILQPPGETNYLEQREPKKEPAD